MFRLRQVSVWFYLGLIIWIIIYLLRKNNIIIPYINSYLTDIISVPMYCYLVELISNWFSKYKREFTLKDVLTSALYLTIIFEVICPYISTKFIADPLDILCYFIGGIIYYFCRKNMINVA